MLPWYHLLQSRIRLRFKLTFPGSHLRSRFSLMICHWHGRKWICLLKNFIQIIKFITYIYKIIITYIFMFHCLSCIDRCLQAMSYIFSISRQIAIRCYLLRKTSKMVESSITRYCLNSFWSFSIRYWFQITIAVSCLIRFLTACKYNT